MKELIGEFTEDTEVATYIDKMRERNDFYQIEYFYQMRCHYNVESSFFKIKKVYFRWDRLLLRKFFEVNQT